MGKQALSLKRQSASSRIAERQRDEKVGNACMNQFHFLHQPPIWSSPGGTGWRARAQAFIMAVNAAESQEQGQLQEHLQ